MNDNYVSLEIAKLLKGKGFNEYCEGCYYFEGYLEITSYKNFKNSLNKYKIAAPTLYIAQKWLREEREIHIMVDVCASGYYTVIWKTNGTFVKCLDEKGPNDGGVWDTYEEALEAGILESLKFI